MLSLEEKEEIKRDETIECICNFCHKLARYRLFHSKKALNNNLFHRCSHYSYLSIKILSHYQKHRLLLFLLYHSVYWGNKDFSQQKVLLG